MNWTTAWISMRQGHKVRRKCWKPAAYLEVVDDKEVYIHTPGGQVRNFRDVANMAIYLGITCCDDWEILEETGNA